MLGRRYQLESELGRGRDLRNHIRPQRLVPLATVSSSAAHAADALAR
jgi:hypothetical protein